MARIRSIKPEFPQSESMGRVSRDARLLFIQLWTLCDDSGRARGNSRMLASLLFPYDDDAPRLIDGWMGELESEGCIRRYEVDGDSYLDIPKWLKHQKIDHASASKYPEFVESSRVLAKVSGRIKEGIKDQGEDQGRDQGAGEGGECRGDGTDPPEAPAASPASPPKQPALAHRLPTDWTLPDLWVGDAKREHPAITDAQIARIAESFADFWHAKGGADARKVDWRATWRTWLRREKVGAERLVFSRQGGHVNRQTALEESNKRVVEDWLKKQEQRDLEAGDATV